MMITKEELNIPNFIELYLEKANTTVSKSQLFQNILTDKRIIVKFSHCRVYLQETDQKQNELEYKNILYLNNSITNENFFCLAYTVNYEENPAIKNKVNALILYSNDVELIDDVIREYAYYVSSELNKNDPKIRYNKMEEDYLKIDQHTCYFCPMQQFIELCEHLNSFTNQQEINDILVGKLNRNLDNDDQSYIFDCINYHSLTMDTSTNLKDKNQLIVALIHKICKKKQTEHLIETFKRKNREIFKIKSDFCLMKSKSCVHSKSSYSNLDFKAEKSGRISVKRSKSADSCELPNVLSKFGSKVKNIRVSKSESKHTSLSNSKFFVENILEKISTDSDLNGSSIFLSNKNCTKRYIFNKVVGFPTSVCVVSTNMSLGNANIITKSTMEQAEEMMTDQPSTGFVFKRFRNRNDILKFWKKVISEQIILNKMDKENKKLTLRAQILSRNEKKNKIFKGETSKFMYTEITPCLKEATVIWGALLNNQFSSLAVISLNDDELSQRPDETPYDIEKIRKIVYKGKI